MNDLNANFPSPENGENWETQVEAIQDDNFEAFYTLIRKIKEIPGSSEGKIRDAEKVIKTIEDARLTGGAEIAFNAVTSTYGIKNKARKMIAAEKAKKNSN